MTYKTREIDSPRLDVEYYGADFPVDVLVKRMREEDYIIPGFQRGYVWRNREASQFIESLLIGLPVPALFLAKDKFSEKYLVIDGQQRLKTLQYFYDEAFPSGEEFKLSGISYPFSGLTYSELSPSYRRSLDNAIIHCIIVAESYDPEGMFYLFERLNTTGTTLKSQEVRNAIYHGPFNTIIQELSESEIWKKLYEKKNDRGDGQELILRFLALYFSPDEYRGNMVSFLNHFMLENRSLDVVSADKIRKIFSSTIENIYERIGPKAFYRNKQFNKVLFESIMLFVARNIDRLDENNLAEAHQRLLTDKSFWEEHSSSTTSRYKVKSREEYINQLSADVLK